MVKLVADMIWRQVVSIKFPFMHEGNVYCKKFTKPWLGIVTYCALAIVGVRKSKAMIKRLTLFIIFICSWLLKMDVNLTINIRLNIISIDSDFKRGRTKNKKIFDPAGVAWFQHHSSKNVRFRWNRISRILTKLWAPWVVQRTYLLLGGGCGKYADEI